MSADSGRLDFFSAADEPDLAGLTLERVEGREALSNPYEYVLELSTTLDGGLAMETIDAWLAVPCGFVFGEVQVSGVLREVKLLPTDDPERTRYRAVLVPRLDRTSRSARSRVYQDQSVLDIVGTVLTLHEVPFENATRDTYPVREYVVQYAESDFAFINRLMEHWGITYYFDQQPDGEVMVLADLPASFEAFPDHEELSYVTHQQGGQLGVHELSRTHRPQTASLTVADYNWRTPYLDSDGHQTERQLQLRATSAVDELTGWGENWRYREHVKDEAEAVAIATVRAQERQARRVSYEGQMSAPGLVPGRRVAVVGMPIIELDQEYLLTEMTTIYERRDESVAGCQQLFTAIAYETPFRPPLRTPCPKIAGFMHAVVDGEVHGTAAPIDEFGRYKLLMAYDTVAAPGGGATRWVRMAQPSAGPNYGMHLPLHIGTEVAVIHLDGDPDRPVIMGAIPNVDTLSPVVDANATQSRIRTRGNILFELEDDA